MHHFIGRFHYLSTQPGGSSLNAGTHLTPLGWIATARVAVCPSLSLTGPRAAAVDKFSAIQIEY